MSENRKSSLNNCWSKEFLKKLESFGWTADLARGKIYAKNWKFYGFKVSPGVIQTNVQEKEQNDYNVLIQVDVLEHYKWDKILNILADNAIYMVKLLTNLMPDSSDDIFRQAGIFLLPQSPKDFHISCSCNSENVLCRHAAAVLYAFIIKYDEVPLLLFKLKGMRKNELNKALREKRSIINNCSGDDIKENYKSVQLEPQEDSYIVENFWVGGMDKANLNIKISPQSTEEFIFNKLGEPAFFGGKRDMIRQLKRDYQRILSKALTAGYFEDDEQ